MASASLWRFKALMRKNFLIFKRNLAFSIFEILFPITILLVICCIGLAFKKHTYLFTSQEKDLQTFLTTRSSAYVNPSYIDSTPPSKLISPYSNEIIFEPTEEQKMSSFPAYDWNGLTVRPILNICLERKVIAIIGKKFPDALLNKLKMTFLATDPFLSESLVYKKYDSVEELEKIVKNNDYGIKKDMPKICFGIFFEKKKDNEYDYSLHYFGQDSTTGITDIPRSHIEYYNKLQQWPDLTEYQKYLKNGYGYIMKIINDYILEENSDSNSSSSPYIDYGIMMQKYDKIKENDFGEKITTLMPICIIIAYICPLIMFTLKMVGDKENKSKEGMKIMGLTEGIYFLSYFVWFLIENLFFALVNSAILIIAFPHIPFYCNVIMCLLYGLNVFALCFFFQSFIDKTRIALILSLIIYFVMYFLVCMVGNMETSFTLKFIGSICPPVIIQYAFMIYAEYEIAYQNFSIKNFGEDIHNYTFNRVMYMSAADFVFYLFLGYYLQNVISHDFGISRPFYFLCTCSYWCGNSNKCCKKNKTKENNSKVESKLNENDNNNNNNNKNVVVDDILSSNESINEIIYENPYENNPDFQNESLYKSKPKEDIFHIHKLKKLFSDGKLAVNEVTFNLYKDEIFALLGHNGAGKTTIISMLTGLYEATSGSAIYNGYNILEGDNMDKFRQKLGICPQHDVLFEDLTVEEHLNLFCHFKGVENDKIEDEINQSLKEFRIKDIKDIVVKNLSAGQRRKLSIAISVIGGSEVIFLDEPSSGMDITSRRNLWEILKRINEKRIIILTTHFMEEASVLGKRIGIISGGEMKCIGNPLFLIDRFGKYITITIVKENGAVNENIIQFFKKWSPNVDYEALSEEILFRILKETDDGVKFDVKNFFKDLDNNLSNLLIKSYSASMPTLEDVFLNVAKREKNNKSKNNNNGQIIEINEEENDRILFEEKYQGENTKCKKFWSDLFTLIVKRFRQIYRDIKTFCLEILCPLLLIIIGLSFCQAKPFYNAKPYSPNFIDLDTNIKIYISSFNNQPIDQKFLDIFNKKDELSNKEVKIGIEQILLDKNSYSLNEQSSSIIDFINKVYDKKNSHNYGSIFILSDNDNTQKHFKFIEILDAKVRQAPVFYNQYFLTKVIKYLTGKEIKINYQHRAFPYTKEAKDDNKRLNYLLLVFFIVVAFSLMPANFITTIIKERINNSKHLMKTSGVSLFSYWLANYIFELLKYYIIGGISLLLIWAFDAYAPYLYILYILYGPSMVSFAYLLSYCFSSEFQAQIGIIVANCLIGALLSALIMLLRTEKNLNDIAFYLAYPLRLIPSFSFGYGYNLLINKILILMVDEPENYLKILNGDTGGDEKMIELKYVGSDIIMLSGEFVVYLVIMIIIEYKQNHFNKVKDDKLISNDINDSLVLEEINKANKDNIINGNGNQKLLLPTNEANGGVTNSTNRKLISKKKKKKKSSLANNTDNNNINNLNNIGEKSDNLNKLNNNNNNNQINGFDDITNLNNNNNNNNNVNNGIVIGMENIENDILNINKVPNTNLNTNSNTTQTLTLDPNAPKRIIKKKKKKKIKKKIKVKRKKKKASKPSDINTSNNLIDQSNYAIKIKNLQKAYQKGALCYSKEINAIKNLSLCVEYGECFGLLGLNGAGKTTTFKCLTKEINPTNGSIYINNKDISTDFDSVRNMFGYCPQFDAIFEYMTVYENLCFYSKIKGMQKDKIDTMITAMLTAMSLTEYRNKISGNLSGGNKRKLSVAISMICNPPIILLDEPSTGMDPEARRFMWAVIHKISTKKKNSSVIMTTHSMDEAETLCKRMGIMVNGEFVCLGSANRIKEKYGFGYEINIHIMPLHENEIEELIENYGIGIDNNYFVSFDNLEYVLEKMDKKEYLDELKNDRLGKNIFEEMTINGGVKVQEIILWIHYVTNAMKTIKEISGYFKEIILTEFIDNNFLFKIKKEKDSKSIGFLFGTIEDCKEKYKITEYSIQQTSLEQIFNKFAANQNNNNNKESKGDNKDNNNNQNDKNKNKIEIDITQNLINRLCY